MITYLYWILVLGIAGALLVVLVRLNYLKPGLLASLTVVLVGWAAYYFHFQQVFVKRYGGVMTLDVPEGQQHISATWKDDNLWIENYDPRTDTCHFREYSRGNVLEGRVVIRNCNPVGAAGQPSPPVD